MELDLQLVPLNGKEVEEGATEDNEQDEDEEEEDLRGEEEGQRPRSVLEGIDWNELGSKVGGVAMKLERYRLACFLTNEVRPDGGRGLGGWR